MTAPRQLGNTNKMAKNIPWHRIFSDFFIISVCLYSSLYLRVGWTETLEYFLPVINTYLAGFLITRSSLFFFMGVYSSLWRYVSTMDAVKLVKAMALSSGIIISASFFTPESFRKLPRSVFIIELVLTTFVLLGARLTRRLLYEKRQGKKKGGSSTLIYGAGQNGRTLAHRFLSDAGASGELVGFIDDDPRMQSKEILGFRVLGGFAQLATTLTQYQIRQLIIAIPHISGERLRQVVEVARPLNIRPKITEPLSRMRMRSSSNLEILRDVELGDLLSRPSRMIETQTIREMVYQKTVLVTGAGGSIGGELARQIMSQNPSQLLLLDHSEYHLYKIDQELRVETNEVRQVVPLLFDLKDKQGLKHILTRYRPSVVFHAAAYKHVHLVEANPFAGILNNIYATKNLLDLCPSINVETFVLISTDKAVHPAGVMGATKRICEILTTASALRTGKNYCSVRFGNVLGSSGSLIPLLKEQIQQGGPVTITHTDVTRYFMLIPEAVSLVLKAATIAKPGDINVLKMGDPVRILDIAKSLMALLGKSEDQIPIVFTGLRPGEKMFEELYIRGDELKTEHPDILTLPNGDSELSHLNHSLVRFLGEVDELVLLAKKESPDTLNKLKSMMTASSPTTRNYIEVAQI